VEDDLIINIIETSESLSDIYYSEFVLGEDELIRLKFHLNNTSKYNALIEGGFLIVPVSMVGRNSTDKEPFSNVKLSGTAPNLSISSENIFDNYGIFDVINKLRAHVDTGFLIQDNQVSSIGSLKYFAGINLDKNTGNIEEKIRNMMFVVKSFDDSDTYLIEFDPYIESSDELLCYSNLFVIVPYLMLTKESGRRIYIKEQFFIIHNKLPEVTKRPIIKGYDPDSTDNSVFTSIRLDSKKKYPIAKYDNSSYDTDDIKKDKVRIEIKEKTADRYFTFMYKSSFPFTLYMAIAGGDRTWIFSNLKKATYKNVNIIYKQNFNKKDEDVLVSGFYPFTEIQDIATWYQDNIGDEKYAPLFLFINPFYRYSLDYLLEKVSNDDTFDSQSKKLSMFGLMSITSETPTNKQSVGYIYQGNNVRYAFDKDDTAPEVGFVFFNDTDI